MSVGARVLKWQVLRAYAGSPVTAYFYPHKLSGGDSVDGRVARLGQQLSWSDVHDGAGTQADTGTTAAVVHVRADGVFATWLAIHRIISTFPTNTIPAAAQVIEAKLRLYCIFKLIEGLLVPTVAVFESNPASYNDLVPADYGQTMAVPLSELIPMADIPVDDFTTWTLNQAGLDKIVPGGVTKLALREATWDAPNVVPPWEAFADREVQFRTADYADAAYHPRLEVTYRVPL